MIALVFLLCLCLQGGATFHLFGTSTKLMGSWPVIPDGWTQRDKPCPNETLTLYLHTQQPAMAELQQRLIDISAPSHPSYGQHMEREEVDDLLRPSNKTTTAITAWLEKKGGVSTENVTQQGHWFTFTITVSGAEELLSTEFHRYSFGGEDTTIIRTLQYSVPTAIERYVASIQPTTRFGQPQAQVMVARDTIDTIDTTESSNVTVPSDATDSPQIPLDFLPLLRQYNDSFCNTTITPACLKGIYNIGDFAADPNGKSMIGVSGYDDEGLYMADVGDFMSIVGTKGQHLNLSVTSINHGVVAGFTTRTGINHTLEGNLDVEYVVGLSPGTPVVYYSTGGRAPELADPDQPTPDKNGTNEPYLDQLTFLLKLSNDQLPDVLVTSYAENEQSIPKDYASVVCAGFATLGARGVSVIFASGDTGVGSACQSNDGKGTVMFTPNFPATCPFVTAVGGTYALKPEIAAAFTSGGFSNHFSAPPYMLGTMKKYLAQLGNKNKGYFNPGGRGYPDVSAQSVRYLVYNQQTPSFAYGTSCAAPTFAAIISNINNLRLAKGKPRLGFLNPWLYSEGSLAFNDITLGHSRGCAGYDIFTGQPSPRIENASWDAIPGWDPVSGWGTPDFLKLRNMLATSGGRVEDD